MVTIELPCGLKVSADDYVDAISTVSSCIKLGLVPGIMVANPDRPLAAQRPTHPEQNI